MALKNLKTFITLFVSLIWLTTGNTRACWFGEESEVIRIAMFRAEMQGMLAFRPFYYTAKYLNSMTPDYTADRLQNIKMWQQELGQDLPFSDVEDILYKVSPDSFITAWKDKKLATNFPKNSFVAKLQLPANKAWLEYIVFAKRNELINSIVIDPWTTEPDPKTPDLPAERKILIKQALSVLPTIKNPDLAKRYAYQLVRLYHQNAEYQKAIDTFNKYFGAKPTENILAIWALIHKAISLDELNKKLEANYLYAQIFNLSDEKKVRCYQCFNSEDVMLMKTKVLAKVNDEKASIVALAAFRNPGLALQQIDEIKKLGGIKYLLVLLMREINKLEDWLVTPQLTESSPSVYYDTTFNHYGEELKIARKVNREKDLKYLKQVLSFVEECYNSTTGETKNYMAICAAHLAFLNDDAAMGKKYLSLIPETAEAGILFQKKADELLLSLLTDDVAKPAVLADIYTKIAFLENAAKTESAVSKMLYAVARHLSLKFEKAGMITEAGLSFLKSELYKYDYSSVYYAYQEGGNREQAYYWHIAWYDRKAKISDLDKLLTLIGKKDKTPFEKYLCDKTTTSVNAYLDLKGTLAYRANNLDLACQTFAQIPENYWQTTYEYKNFLNEDPFMPKIWPHKRDFSYQFNKTKFLKRLIDLRDEAKKNPAKRAENYLLLGHAMYNTSYWGNAWMMTSYSWSVLGPVAEAGTYFDLLFGNSTGIQSLDFKTYYECQRAFDYYKMARDEAKDPEIAASAQFMMHACNYNVYAVSEMTASRPWDAPAGIFTPLYVTDLYTKYKSTKTFETVRCPLMDAFIEGKD
jgi:hypothetical protein